ncbi:hypothetical protein ACFYU9_05660 [Streptomyces sp. NPDC004327]|uniref:hypothetical protein n=1 Tax=Streptomyces sp. NPDC004327 TaxID=3364699 RepID=UPI00367789E1
MRVLEATLVVRHGMKKMITATALALTSLALAAPAQAAPAHHSTQDIQGSAAVLQGELDDTVMLIGKLAGSHEGDISESWQLAKNDWSPGH